MRSLNQKGFEPISLILIVVLIAVVAFAGYKVVTMNRTADSAATTSTGQEAGAPEKINNKEDLEQTDKALNESDAELDKNLNDEQLDADVDSML